MIASYIEGIGASFITLGVILPKRHEFIRDTSALLLIFGIILLGLVPLILFSKQEQPSTPFWIATVTIVALAFHSLRKSIHPTEK